MQQRGVITEYEINMTRLLRAWEDVDQHSNSTVFKTHQLYLDVGGLDNYTEYRFFIVAYTKEGPGPKSEEVVFETLQNGKFYAVSFCGYKGQHSQTMERVLHKR